jgi:hypothetical protein
LHLSLVSIFIKDKKDANNEFIEKNMGNDCQEWFKKSYIDGKYEVRFFWKCIEKEMKELDSEEKVKYLNVMLNSPFTGLNSGVLEPWIVGKAKKKFKNDYISEYKKFISDKWDFLEKVNENFGEKSEEVSWQSLLFEIFENDYSFFWGMQKKELSSRNNLTKEQGLDIIKKYKVEPREILESIGRNKTENNILMYCLGEFFKLANLDKKIESLKLVWCRELEIYTSKISYLGLLLLISERWSSNILVQISRKNDNIGEQFEELYKTDLQIILNGLAYSDDKENYIDLLECLDYEAETSQTYNQNLGMPRKSNQNNYLYLLFNKVIRIIPNEKALKINNDVLSEYKKSNQESLIFQKFLDNYVKLLLSQWGES